MTMMWGKSLIVAAGLMPAVAQAGYICESEAAAIKLQTFTLSSADIDLQNWQLQKPAATVLKKDGGQWLYSGTVVDIPTRVGWAQTYSLTSTVDEDVEIRLQGIVSWGGGECTRAGCPAPVEIITGTLAFQGAHYDLACVDSQF